VTQRLTEREAFEAWARANRPDLDLRYMYDADGNYHHDGYIWQDSGDAFRIWQAALSSAQQEAPEARPDTLCGRLQQQCSDWGVYWRGPDAHGVNLSHQQAVELLRDALGVEVEIAAPLPPTGPCDGCDVFGGCPEYCRCGNPPKVQP
jgi:hypothetical protein